MTPDSAALWIVLGIAAEAVLLVTWALEWISKRLSQPAPYDDTSRGRSPR